MKRTTICLVLLAGLLSVLPASAAETLKVVFMRDAYPNGRPWIADLDGGNAAELADVALASLPRIANNTVVFMLDDYDGQGSGIYKMEASPGATITKIPNTENIRTANGPNYDAIDISPDGSRIAWSAPESGDYYQNHNVFVANIDGSGKTRLLRNTSKHYFMINWGEPDRIALQISNVGSATSQRPHTMKPDGSGLVQVISDFAQDLQIGGPDGRAAMRWGNSTSRPLVTTNNSFGDWVQVPGPLVGYSITSWHPTQDALFGSRNGNLYRVERTTGVETLLVTGGTDACYGGDVGEGVGGTEDTYVALGDSFSSGEGAGKYDPESNKRNENKCRRSEYAWPSDNPGSDANMQVPSFGAFSRDSSACSGAWIRDLEYSNAFHHPGWTNPEEPQLDNPALESADLVTVTIGGNDALFGTVMEWCLQDAGGNCFDETPWGDGWGTLSEVIDGYVDVMRGGELASAYLAIKDSAPAAAVFVVSYPRVVDPNVLVFSNSEATRIREIADAINSAVECSADEAGVHFVDEIPAHFDDHLAGSLRLDWINNYEQSSFQESFHPNKRGQKEYARIVRKAVGSGPGIRANPSPDPGACGAGDRSSESEASPLPSLGDLVILASFPAACGSSDASYAPSQDITLMGAGFAESASVNLGIRYEDGTLVALGTTSVDGSGLLETQTAIPSNAPTSGRAQVQALGPGMDGGPLLLLNGISLGESMVEDSDSDSIPDICDNCPGDGNPSQTDTDGDAVGDECDVCPLDSDDDWDDDGSCSDTDICEFDPENDADGDGFCADDDNCPQQSNPDQLDGDLDGVGNLCDMCLGNDLTGDSDKDGICADRDCNDSDPTNACHVFSDGFESGDTATWSGTRQ